MATIADVIKKYGSMEAFKAANTTTPKPTAPNTFTNNASFAASTATPAVPTNTKSVAPTYSGPNQNVTTNPDGSTTYNPGGTPRQPATVATPANPVISKTFTTDTQYDPANPKDYLMEIQARLATGGKPLTAPEYKQFLVAQEAINNQSQQSGITDPYSGNIQSSQSQLDQELLNEKNRDTSALGAYKTALDAQYGIRANQTTQAGEKRKEAEQKVYSFSGFGRSTAAADAQGKIEAETQSALGALEAAKQAEIAAKQAELEGADSDTVAALRSQVGAYQKASQDFQIASIKATAEANQKGGASYTEAINNLMATAAANKIDIGDPKVVEAYAKIARNADGTVNEGVIKALPADVQAIIRSAVQTSQPTEAAKTVVDGSGKKAQTYQWNPQTQRYDIAVGGQSYSIAGSGTGGGGAGGATGQPNTEQAELISRLARINQASQGSLVRSSGLIDPNIQADIDYVKANMTFDKLQQLKNSGVKLGVLSDSDMRILGQSAVSIGSGMTKERIKQETDRLIKGLGGTVTSTPSTGTTSAPATTAPAKNNTPQSSQGVDYALSLMD